MRLSQGVTLSCALLFASSAMAQDEGRTVSLTLRAMNAKRLVAELSQASGVPLAVGESVSRDIVAISVREKPLSEVMARLARALNAEWVKEGASSRLIRTAEGAEADRRRERDSRTQTLSRLIVDATAPLDRPWTETTAERLARDYEAQLERERRARGVENLRIFMERERLHPRTPANRALHRLLRTLDPVQLAALEPDSRLVYSLSPTRMQRPLGPAARQALAQFAREQQEWAAAWKRLPQRADEEDDDFGAAIGADPLESDPTDVLLIATRWPDDEGITFELRTIDEDGFVLATANESIGGIWSTAAQLIEIPPGADAGAEMDLAEESRAILQALRHQMSGTRAPQLSEDLRRKLASPDRHEPLSAVPTDFLLALARERKADLIAYIPDSAASIAHVAAAQARPSAAGLRAFAGTCGLELAEEPGWLIATPAQPWTARVRRTDRSALAELLAIVASGGTPSLDFLAGYALRAPNPMTDALSMTVLSVLGKVSFPEASRWEALRFYGSLRPGDRTALRAGRALNLSSLGAQALAHLGRLVYGSQPNLFRMPDAPAEGMDGAPMPAMEVEGDIEPTEALPLGIPGDGQVSLSIETSDILVPVTDRPDYRRPFTPEELGSLLAYAERTDLDAMGAPPARIALVEVGARTALTFSFRFTAETAMVESLSDWSVNPQAMSLDRLPPRIRQALDAAAQEARDSLKNLRPEDFQKWRTSGKPPPP